MVKRNVHLAKLNAGYLFPEITKRKQALLERQPHAQLISLGIGDTTQPLSQHVSLRLQEYASGLATLEGYSGYGPEQGQAALRQRISEKLYGGTVNADEVFISDGSKCDIGRLQLLFGANASIAVQDPTYPVYVDTGVIMGQSSHYNADHARYGQFIYMHCLPSNGFFPDLTSLPRTDVIYFCSPNNPTGSVATRQQLTELVAFAKRNRSIIVFDAAYACYIRDPNLPRSIYEIAGAREVAIELGSFSKMAGFTGVRLAWSIVPNELYFEDGAAVRNDWHRIATTCFNGASNIAQRGGLAVLEDQGWQDVQRMVNFYMENASLIKRTLEELGLAVYGAIQAPYVWVHFPQRRSWDVFEEILEKTHIITTPGSGFGSGGECFLRFSAFNHRSAILEAMKRLRHYWNHEES